MRMRMVGAIVLCVIGAVFGGCSRYVTPGAAASFRAMGITPEEVASGTDFAMREKMDRKPLAGFPCVIALARVQGPGYSSFSERAYGSGKYSVVTGRTVETDEHIKTGVERTATQEEAARVLGVDVTDIQHPRETVEGIFRLNVQA